MEVFHLWARLALDRSRFEADLKAAQGSGEQAAERVRSSWQRTGQAIEESLRRARPASTGLLLFVSGLMASLTAAAAASVKFNAELEQTAQGFEVMLGSAEKARAFLDELARFASTTPFEFPGLVQASQRLLAMGFSASEILPTMRAVGDAVAALGAGQEGIDRLVRALGQMQARGKAASQELLQITELGVPAYELLAAKIGVSVPEAMQLVEKGAIDARTAIDALVSGMEERFGGMMERQSRRFLGLWSTIKDTLRLRAGEAFEPLFEAAKRWEQRLAEFVQSERFAQMVENLRQAVERFVAFAEGAVERLRPFGEWLARHADVVIPSLTGAIMLGLVPALGALGKALYINLAPFAPWLAAGAALGALLALLTRRSREAAAAQEDYRAQAERNLRALDEQARKIQEELQQLDRLLPVVEDLGRKQDRTAEETQRLEAALKALQERYPWVRTEIAGTGEAFDSQLQVLANYRTNLRGMLQDIVQAKELIARLTLPQLERDLARAQQELAAARQEAARVATLQDVLAKGDLFQMGEILKKAGVEIDKSKGLFGTFSDYVQRQSNASAERLQGLSQRVQDLTAQIHELKQAQQDALTFRATGQLPSRSATSTPAPAAPPARSAQAVELPPVLSVREAVQAAAQAADTITQAFWEGIKAGMVKRGATPVELAEALSALLDSGRPMSDELRAQLEEEYRALLPQITQGAVSLAKAQSTAFRAEAEAGMEQAVRDSAPWMPDSEATRQALAEADRAGQDQARQFVEGLLAGLRARGATAQEITQVIADLLDSGLDLSDETRQMLERTYEDLLPQTTAWAVRLAKAQGDAQRQAFEDWQADYQQHEAEKTRIAREAWTLRYQLQADAARSADHELAGIERLQVERGRQADADRYASLADYYTKADERAKEAAQRQQEYEEALFRWRKAIGDVTLQEELERDRKRIESLGATTTQGMMALETFYESWAQRIPELKDEEKKALAEQLQAWMEVYGSDGPIAQTVRSLYELLTEETKSFGETFVELFRNLGHRIQETLAESAGGALSSWFEAQNRVREASEDVARAQQAYNEAVAQYGEKSEQARRAADELAQAQKRLQDAMAEAGNFGKMVADTLRKSFQQLSVWFVTEMLKSMTSGLGQWLASNLAIIAKAIWGFLAQAYSALVSWFWWLGPAAPVAAGAVIAGAVAAIGSMLAKAGASLSGGAPTGGGADTGTGGRQPGAETGGTETGGGVQVAQLTGPDRDFFAGLLAPLAALQVFQGTSERIYGAQVETNEWLARIYGAIAGVDAPGADLAGVGAGAEATAAAIREQTGVLHTDLREIADLLRNPVPFPVYPAAGAPPFPVALDHALRTGGLGGLEELMARTLSSGLRGMGRGR
ncbi:MAG: tape measure protein [Limnochordaceae bacterium]|nr:tape measure protein [Limnochordaceae bacterium]